MDMYVLLMGEVYDTYNIIEFISIILSNHTRELFG